MYFMSSESSFIYIFIYICSNAYKNVCVFTWIYLYTSIHIYTITYGETQYTTIYVQLRSTSDSVLHLAAIARKSPLPYNSNRIPMYE